jgi:bifunctional N-acetylglucosamine-1-phosphate-uridyltransferase/glucosamine-1-phosphate-acetyltransferase GlmU-like protein
MTQAVSVARYVADMASTPWAACADLEPWLLVSQVAERVLQRLQQLQRDEYNLTADVAVHRSATIEGGAVLKGPLIVGARCWVASGATLRGGNWIAEDCTFGPGTELKSSFIFAGTKLAHFNFVGDSILGAGVNLEAGSIICNHRNERADKQIFVVRDGALHATGVSKFGALVGDRCRIGANAVVAPGALLAAGTVVARTQLIDQEAQARRVAQTAR